MIKIDSKAQVKWNDLTWTVKRLFEHNGKTRAILEYDTGKSYDLGYNWLKRTNEYHKQVLKCSAYVNDIILNH